MSIDDHELNYESTSKIHLERFTNRHNLIRLFAEYLNDKSSHENILFFHGDSGNGKSLLLKFLQQNCCHHFDKDTWTQLKQKSNQELEELFIKTTKWKGAKLVPSVLLDFGQQPRGDEQPQDPFYGLLMLKRRLTNNALKQGYHLKFPLYDFASVWYLYQKGKSSEEIKKLFPVSETAALIAPFIDVIAKTPVGTFGKAVIDFFMKDFGDKFNIYLQKRNLNPEQVDEICHLDPDTELINLLPKFFAEDLNVAIIQDKDLSRIVLFFDTHENFWGEQNYKSQERCFYRDEWLRNLIRGLKLESGIIVVVAGREKPLWHKATKAKIDQKYLNPQLIRNLSSQDAQIYLNKAEIFNNQWQEILIKCATVTHQQIHPLSLSLAVDIIQAYNKKGICLDFKDFEKNEAYQDKCEELLERFFKYIDDNLRDAIYALSACRSFNKEIYLMLGNALNFHHTEASFRHLTNFCFVWEYQNEGYHRIHDLIRRLVHEFKEGLTSEAHKILFNYYKDKKELAEALYHATCINREKGIEEWLKHFTNATKSNKLKFCRQLLQIREELCF